MKNRSISSNMKFLAQKINGVFLITSKTFFDHRGVFTRSFCEKEFKKKRN